MCEECVNEWTEGRRVMELNDYEQVQRSVEGKEGKRKGRDRKTRSEGILGGQGDVAQLGDTKKEEWSG